MNNKKDVDHIDEILGDGLTKFHRRKVFIWTLVPVLIVLSGVGIFLGVFFSGNKKHEPQLIDFDNVFFLDQSFIYDGGEYSISVTGDIPENTVITYTYGETSQTEPIKFKEAKDYTISATLTKSGYNPKTLEGTLKILDVFVVDDEGQITGVKEAAKELTEIVIPETYEERKIVKIGDKAFSDCIKLERVEIPNDVKELGSAPFVGCDNLKEVEFKNTSTWINTNDENDSVFDVTEKEKTIENLKDGNNTLRRLDGLVASVTHNNKNKIFDKLEDASNKLVEGDTLGVYSTIEELKVEKNNITIKANTSEAKINKLVLGYDIYVNIDNIQVDEKANTNAKIIKNNVVVYFSDVQNAIDNAGVLDTVILLTDHDKIEINNDIKALDIGSNTVKNLIVEKSINIISTTNDVGRVNKFEIEAGCYAEISKKEMVAEANSQVILKDGAAFNISGCKDTPSTLTVYDTDLTKTIVGSTEFEDGYFIYKQGEYDAYIKVGDTINNYNNIKGALEAVKEGQTITACRVLNSITLEKDFAYTLDLQTNSATNITVNNSKVTITGSKVDTKQATITKLVMSDSIDSITIDENVLVKDINATAYASIEEENGYITYYKNLSDALKVESNKTITLLSKVTDKIQINTPTTIDLNNFNMSDLVINEFVTIKNSTQVGKTATIGNIEMKKGTLTIDDSSVISSTKDTTVTLTNLAKLEIKGNTAPSKLIVKDGEYTVIGSSTYDDSYFYYEQGNYESKIESTKTYYTSFEDAIKYASSGATIKVLSSVVTNEIKPSNPIILEGSENGYITTETSLTLDGRITLQNLNISASSLIATKTSKINIVGSDVKYNTYAISVTSFTVSDQMVSGAYVGSGVSLNSDGKVTEGYFYNKSNVTLADNHVKVIDNSNGDYYVELNSDEAKYIVCSTKANEEAEEKFYTSLDIALEGLKQSNGGIISLRDDVSYTSANEVTFASGTTYTFEGNNHTIKNLNFIIKGNATIQNVEFVDCSDKIIEVQGNVGLHSVKFDYKLTSTNQLPVLINSKTAQFTFNDTNKSYVKIGETSYDFKFGYINYSAIKDSKNNVFDSNGYIGQNVLLDENNKIIGGSFLKCSNIEGLLANNYYMFDEESYIEVSNQDAVANQKVKFGENSAVTYYYKDVLESLERIVDSGSYTLLTDYTLTKDVTISAKGITFITGNNKITINAGKVLKFDGTDTTTLTGTTFNNAKFVLNSGSYVRVKSVNSNEPTGVSVIYDNQDAKVDYERDDKYWAYTSKAFTCSLTTGNTITKYETIEEAFSYINGLETTQTSFELTLLNNISFTKDTTLVVGSGKSLIINAKKSATENYQINLPKLTASLDLTLQGNITLKNVTINAKSLKTTKDSKINIDTNSYLNNNKLTVNSFTFDNGFIFDSGSYIGQGVVTDTNNKVIEGYFSHDSKPTFNKDTHLKVYDVQTNVSSNKYCFNIKEISGLTIDIGGFKDVSIFDTKENDTWVDAQDKSITIDGTTYIISSDGDDVVLINPDNGEEYYLLEDESNVDINNDISSSGEGTHVSYKLAQNISFKVKLGDNTYTAELPSSAGISTREDLTWDDLVEHKVVINSVEYTINRDSYTTYSGGTKSTVTYIYLVQGNNKYQLWTTTSTKVTSDLTSPTSETEYELKDKLLTITVIEDYQKSSITPNNSYIGDITGIKESQVGSIKWNDLKSTSNTITLGKNKYTVSISENKVTLTDGTNTNPLYISTNQIASTDTISNSNTSYYSFESKQLEVAKVGTKSYQTFDAAYKDCETSGSTITLLKDCTMDFNELTELSKTVTIAGGGYTLTLDTPSGVDTISNATFSNMNLVFNATSDKNIKLNNCVLDNDVTVTLSTASNVNSKLYLIGETVNNTSSTFKFNSDTALLYVANIGEELPQFTFTSTACSYNASETISEETTNYYVYCRDVNTANNNIGEDTITLLTDYDKISLTSETDNGNKIDINGKVVTELNVIADIKILDSNQKVDGNIKNITSSNDVTVSIVDSITLSNTIISNDKAITLKVTNSDSKVELNGVKVGSNDLTLADVIVNLGEGVTGFNPGSYLGLNVVYDEEQDIVGGRFYRSSNPDLDNDKVVKIYANTDKDFDVVAIANIGASVTTDSGEVNFATIADAFSALKSGTVTSSDGIVYVKKSSSEVVNLTSTTYTLNVNGYILDKVNANANVNIDLNGGIINTLTLLGGTNTYLTDKLYNDKTNHGVVKNIVFSESTNAPTLTLGEISFSKRNEHDADTNITTNNSSLSIKVNKDSKVDIGNTSVQIKKVEKEIEFLNIIVNEEFADDAYLGQNIEFDTNGKVVGGYFYSRTNPILNSSYVKVYEKFTSISDERANYYVMLPTEAPVKYHDHYYMNLEDIINNLPAEGGDISIGQDIDETLQQTIRIKAGQTVRISTTNEVGGALVIPTKINNIKFVIEGKTSTNNEAGKLIIDMTTPEYWGANNEVSLGNGATILFNMTNVNTAPTIKYTSDSPYKAAGYITSSTNDGKYKFLFVTNVSKGLEQYASLFTDTERAKIDNLTIVLSEDCGDLSKNTNPVVLNGYFSKVYLDLADLSGVTTTDTEKTIYITKYGSCQLFVKDSKHTARYNTKVILECYDSSGHPEYDYFALQTDLIHSDEVTEKSGKNEVSNVLFWFNGERYVGADVKLLGNGELEEGFSYYYRDVTEALEKLNTYSKCKMVLLKTVSTTKHRTIDKEGIDLTIDLNGKTFEAKTVYKLLIFDDGIATTTLNAKNGSLTIINGNTSNSIDEIQTQLVVKNGKLVLGDNVLVKNQITYSNSGEGTASIEFTSNTYYSSKTNNLDFDDIKNYNASYYETEGDYIGKDVEYAGDCIVRGIFYKSSNIKKHDTAQNKWAKQNYSYEIYMDSEVVATAGSSSYTSLQAALDGADGNTIYLVKDTTVSEGLTLSKDSTIDLNGYKLNITNDIGITFNDYTLTIENGDITLNSKTITCEGNSTELNLNDVTFSTGSSIYVNQDGSKVIIKNSKGDIDNLSVYSKVDGKVIQLTGYNESKDWVLEYSTKECYLKHSDGTRDKPVTLSEALENAKWNDTIILTKDVTFTGTLTAVSKEVTIDLNGFDIEGEGRSTISIKESKVKFIDSKIYSNEETRAHIKCILSVSDRGVLELDNVLYDGDNRIEVNSKTATIRFTSNTKEYNSGSGSEEIFGFTFDTIEYVGITELDSKYYVGKDVSLNNDVFVTSGTFKNGSKPRLEDNYYAVTENGGVTFEVTDQKPQNTACMINDVRYDSLKDALNNALQGNTIILKNNCTISKDDAINLTTNGIIINCNGYTLTVEEGGLTIRQGATLYISQPKFGENSKIICGIESNLVSSLEILSSNTQPSNLQVICSDGTAKNVVIGSTKGQNYVYNDYVCTLTIRTLTSDNKIKTTRKNYTVLATAMEDVNNASDTISITLELFYDATIDTQVVVNNQIHIIFNHHSIYVKDGGGYTFNATPLFDDVSSEDPAYLLMYYGATVTVPWSTNGDGIYIVAVDRQNVDNYNYDTGWIYNPVTSKVTYSSTKTESNPKFNKFNVSAICDGTNLPLSATIQSASIEYEGTEEQTSYPNTFYDLINDNNYVIRINYKEEGVEETKTKDFKLSYYSELDAFAIVDENGKHIAYLCISRNGLVSNVGCNDTFETRPGLDNFLLKK